MPFSIAGNPQFLKPVAIHLHPAHNIGDHSIPTYHIRTGLYMSSFMPAEFLDISHTNCDHTLTRN